MIRLQEGRHNYQQELSDNANDFSMLLSYINWYLDLISIIILQ